MRRGDVVPVLWSCRSLVSISCPSHPSCGTLVPPPPARPEQRAGFGCRRYEISGSFNCSLSLLECLAFESNVTGKQCLCIVIARAVLAGVWHGAFHLLLEARSQRCFGLIWGDLAGFERLRARRNWRRDTRLGKVWGAPSPAFVLPSVFPSPK